MKSKIIVGLLVIILIGGFAAKQLIFDQKGLDGSLPKETLLLQKKYIEDHLKKYHYDYKVILDFNEDDYGILSVAMYRGDCEVVEKLIRDAKDKIMSKMATTQPEICMMAKK